MTTIDTSTAIKATVYSSQRKVARTSTGRVWAAFYNGTGMEFWYSDDAGSSFTQNASATISGAIDGSLFIDVDDHAHFAYSDSSTDVYYRRMPSIGTATSWASATTVDASGSESGFPDVVAHREGSGWQVWVAYSITGATANRARVAKLSVSSGGAVTLDAPNHFASTNYGGTTGDHTYPSIDFHHTGDGKTVQGGTPHLFVVMSSHEVGSFDGIRMSKATYSTGSWTWGTERTLDSANYAASGRLCSVFDGSRLLAAYAKSSAISEVGVVERDAADTATTTRTPTALSDGAVTGVGVTYDTVADLHLWAIGTTSDDVKRITYDRSAGSWDGTWTTVATATANADSLTLKRGNSGNAAEALYTDGSGSPYNIVFASAALNQPPTAATWDVTDNQAHDVAETLTLDWTFNDPNEGDTQSKYALRRQIGAGSYEYFNAGTTSWGASEVENTSATTSVALASSWGSDGDSNHKYAVKTWDTAGLEGSYSSELTVIPSAQDNPTISSPADSGTVTSPSVTVTWSATTQTAYKARLLSDADAQLETSGWVTSTSTSHAFSYSLANSTDYKVEVATRNDEGLASDADTHTFSVSFTPPSTPTITVTGSNANAYITVAITNPGAGATEDYNDVFVRLASSEDRADIDRPVGGDGIRIAAGVAVDGSFIDRAVAGGKDYEYMVRCYADTGATADSAWT